MSLETLDKANVQRLVDVLAQKNMQLDRDEALLQKKLERFTEFFSIETPFEDENGDEILIPYQFRKENHKEFKEFSIPISKAMWSVSKVVAVMRQELYRQETPMPNLTNQLGMAGESKGIINTLKEVGKKLYKDPHSPYNATKEELKTYSEIPGEWRNMLHIYELNIRHRPRINTRAQLDKILDDIVIVFNARIEPFVFQLQHQANIILKTETEEKIVSLLTTYNQIAERHEKLMMGMGLTSPQIPLER